MTVSVGTAVAEGVSVGVPVWVGDDVGEGVAVGAGAGIAVDVGSASCNTFAGPIMATSGSPAPLTIFADMLNVPLVARMATCCHMPALSANVTPTTLLAPSSPVTATCTSAPGSAVPVINRVPGSVAGPDGRSAESAVAF